MSSNDSTDETVATPAVWERRSKHSRFPFGKLDVGQSIVIRGVDAANLDRVLDAWRKRKNIDMGRVFVHGSEYYECRVFRRS